MTERLLSGFTYGVFVKEAPLAFRPGHCLWLEGQHANLPDQTEGRAKSEGRLSPGAPGSEGGDTAT